MKRKKQQNYKIILEKCPYTCPHCNRKIIIKQVTIYEIGQKILIPCYHCKGLIRIKIVGPLLSDFVIQEYNTKENIRIEK